MPLLLGEDSVEKGSAVKRFPRLRVRCLEIFVAGFADCGRSLKHDLQCRLTEQEKRAVVEAYTMVWAMMVWFGGAENEVKIEEHRHRILLSLEIAINQILLHARCHSAFCPLTTCAPINISRSCACDSVSKCRNFATLTGLLYCSM